ncbi:hypothetical protein [Roseateles sp.]|uniref:hypothetical protein n=1 Tax=Roseateles sp. TaxID=1971397 RepID=UPI003BA9C6C5
MKVWSTLLLATCTAHAALAQTLEARRYRTSDGVEVLTSRPAPVSAAASVPMAAMAAPAPLPAAPAQPAQAQRVPAGAQIDRDRERFSILNAELMTEAKALSAKRQALASPRASLDLTSEQLQALRDNIARHEENIHAINREIRRLPASAVSGPMAGLQSAAFKRLAAADEAIKAR